jgi:hypothetical protein
MERVLEPRKLLQVEELGVDRCQRGLLVGPCSWASSGSNASAASYRF